MAAPFRDSPKTQKRDSLKVESGELDMVLWRHEGGAMLRKGHTEEQIVYALRQVEGGKKVSEVCREMGVSPQAFYRWKRRYGGLGLKGVRELREGGEEKRKVNGIVV